MPEIECRCGCPVVLETPDAKWRMLDLDYWNTPDDEIDTDRLDPKIDTQANAIVVWCPIPDCLLGSAYQHARQAIMVALGHHIQTETHNPHIHAFSVSRKVNGS